MFVFIGSDMKKLILEKKVLVSISIFPVFSEHVYA